MTVNKTTFPYIFPNKIFLPKYNSRFFYGLKSLNKVYCTVPMHVCVFAFFLQGLDFCNLVPNAKIKTGENKILVRR